MTWMLRLYPRAWRERYGPEIEEIVAAQPRSLQLAVDLLGGAIDAHWKPQGFARRLESAGAVKKGGTDMVHRLKGCRTQAGPTIKEALLAAGWMIGAALLLAGVLAGLRATGGSSQMIERLGSMTFPIVILLGVQPLYLRGHSRAVKIALIGGPLLILIGIAVLSAMFRT